MGGWLGKNVKPPVSLVQVRLGEGKKYLFNEAEVEEYFLSSNVRDLHIAVISVAGIMRAGKSFILSFFLKYLMFRYHNEGTGKKVNIDDWMGDEDTQMGGFPWKHSPLRQTSGINMWSHIFECQTIDGEKVGILLVDTQGTMDGQSRSSVWSGIFAISMMISSVQIYNVMRDIGEEQLQNLELYSGYAKMVTDVSAGDRTFQHLLFLVRDFRHGGEYGFGFQGGLSYAQDQIIDNGALQEEHREVRANIVSWFDELSCCLLPEPGRKVSESQDFDGKLKDIDHRFKVEVKKLISTVLSPERLVLKRINGELVTAKQLFNHIKMWVNLFNWSDMPEPTSIFRATAENHHLKVVETAKELYLAKMNAAGCSGLLYIDSRKLEKSHARAKNQSLEFFDENPKLGEEDEDVHEAFKRKLDDFIIEKYAEYTVQNQARLECVWNELRTPIFCLIGLIFCVIWENVFFIVNQGVWVWWVRCLLIVITCNWLKDILRKILRGKVED